MAVTQADIDALNRAIADGVRQVSIQGQTTVYGTPESLIKARDDAQAQLNLQSLKTAGKQQNRRSYLYYGGRGYNE